MKRLLVLLLLTFFFFGCAAAQRSEFFKHDSMYGSWSHMGFSWTGHKKCDPKKIGVAKQEKWWGEEVVCP